jgi:hypothetical protein
VSMNGVLASEACNCVRDLLAGYSTGHSGAGHWQYDGRAGELQPTPYPHDAPTAPHAPKKARAVDPPPEGLTDVLATATEPVTARRNSFTSDRGSASSPRNCSPIVPQAVQAARSA